MKRLLFITCVIFVASPLLFGQSKKILPTDEIKSHSQTQVTIKDDVIIDSTLTISDTIKIDIIDVDAGTQINIKDNVLIDSLLHLKTLPVLSSDSFLVMLNDSIGYAIVSITSTDTAGLAWQLGSTDSCVNAYIDSMFSCSPIVASTDTFEVTGLINTNAYYGISGDTALFILQHDVDNDSNSVIVGQNNNYQGIGNYIMGIEAGENAGAIQQSVLIGNQTGRYAGSQNILIGNRAGYYNTGTHNVSIGFDCNAHVSIAKPSSYSIHMGYLAGELNTGDYCVMIGNQSGRNNTGDENTYLGASAGLTGTSARWNVAVGTSSLGLNQTGQSNVALGRQAGFSTTGSGSVFLGYMAGANYNGNNKLFISNSNTATPLIYGDFATGTLDINTILDVKGREIRFAGGRAFYVPANALTDLYMGLNAGNINATGSYNLAIGGGSLASLTSGVRNIAIGESAGEGVTTNEDNVFIGYNSGKVTETSHNIFIGAYTGEDNSTGDANVFIGHHAGLQNTTGEENICIGYLAGSSNLTGNENTLVGYAAGLNCTAGANSFFGHQAGYDNTSGTSNTLIGYESGRNVEDGYSNSMLGVWSGFLLEDGIRNTCVGRSSGYSNVSGSYNVTLGYAAGYSHTGSNSIFIGASAGYNETASNRLYIEPTNAGAGGALIYGEFDNDIAGINGDFFVDSLKYVCDCEDLADDGTINLPDATAGKVEVWLNEGTEDELIIARVYNDGSVTHVTTNGNTANTDADTNLCLYDSGTGATIKNRLGSKLVVCYEFKTQR